MGIQGLGKLIADLAPTAITDREIKSFFSRRVAIDASMSLYQFLIAVRSEGSQLTTADGETTSHLSGMFYRTVRMVENGIKPVYVFDGKPPKLKAGELERRSERRVEAEAALEKAIDEGDEQEADKHSRRIVKVSGDIVQETKRLLDLMGIPHITAPSEAEAQCAELVRGGKVFAVGTEDMDALTFGAAILLRHLTFSEARKMPVKEYHLDKMLEGLEMSMDQFIDLCILLGCDYCEKIRGLGPKSAIKLVQDYKSIERILESVDKKKYSVPDNWLFREARALFKSPEVTPSAQIELHWSKPDEDGLVKFLCEEKGFSEERIRRGAAKLVSARSGTVQVRIDSFFKVMPKSGTGGTKRKSEESDRGARKFRKKNK